MNNLQDKIDSAESNYKVTALGFNLSKEEKELIQRLIKVTLNTTPNIIDLISHCFEYKNEDLIICFGKFAQKEIDKQESILSQVAFLPIPNDLLPEEENEKTRVEAFNILSGIKLEKKIDKNTSDCYPTLLNESSLPNLSANEVLTIEKLNPNGWVGRTRDGKTIRLSSNKSKVGSEDISMTFAELYALKLAAELLDIKEFELVPSIETPSNGSTKPSH